MRSTHDEIRRASQPCLTKKERYVTLTMKATRSNGSLPEEGGGKCDRTMSKSASEMVF